MAESKGPQITTAKRIEGRPEGSLRRGRNFPPSPIDLTTAAATATPFPVHGYDRASVELQVETVAAAVIEIEGSGGSGGQWVPLSPRLRLKAGVVAEYDFNIVPFAHIRGRVVTLDANASDNAAIWLSCYHK